MRQRVGVDAARGETLQQRVGHRPPPPAGDLDQRCAASRGKRAGHVKADIVQERDHVARPADRDRDRPERVLEDQVPPDDPGDDLPEGRVAVGVGAPRHGHEGGEFRVAQRRKDRRHAGQHEGEHDRRPGVERRNRAREHEDAGPDDRPDSEHREVQRAQSALQAVVGERLGLQIGDALASEQVHDRLAAMGKLRVLETRARVGPAPEPVKRLLSYKL